LCPRYDVYTPTQNIVYHDFQPQPDGHGPMEWLKPRFERFRIAALRRIRTFLELPNGIENFNRANLGIYGLGKRRTLKQLADFVRIDMDTKKDREDWVSYSFETWCHTGRDVVSSTDKTVHVRFIFLLC